MSDIERALLPHLDAAYNLARWLTGSREDAEDVVQEACVRALKFWSSFKGGDGRAWFLAIVRNAGHDWLRRHRSHEAAPFDEEIYTPEDDVGNPELALLRQADRDRVRDALEALPVLWREVLVLRELEELSYKQIGEIARVPIGTVMSRLSRARARLHQQLAAGAAKE